MQLEEVEKDEEIIGTAIDLETGETIALTAEDVDQIKNSEWR